MITIYGVYFLIYLVICFFYAFYIVTNVKSKNKLVDFLVVFWLMTFQIYKTEYVWREFPRLGTFRKFDQFLAWFLLGILLLKFITNEKPLKKTKLLSYEKYFYLYILFSMFVLYLHQFLGNISYSKAISSILLYFAAGSFFFTLSKFMTRELIQAIFKAIVFLGVITSIVSILQFFVDTKLLRLAAYYMAFPGYNRSSGVLMWPYDNGMFLLLAIFVVAYTIKNFRIRVILISLFIFCIVLAFTRGIWIALIAVSLIHGYIYYKVALRKLFIAIPIIAVLTIGIVGAYAIQKDYFSGEAWTERVFADTVTVRMSFYAFVLQAIPGSWLIGYGDVENNEVYFKGMVGAKQGLAWSLGRRGGIHNVILQEAFLKGILSPLFYIIFFMKFFKFSYYQSIYKRSYFYCISSNYTMGYFFYVFSIGSYLLSRSGYLTILFLAMNSGVFHKNLNVTDITTAIDDKNLPKLKLKKIE